VTCIVAVEHEGAVWMGGDSAAVKHDSMQMMLMREPKVFVNGPVIFGISGSPRMGQILRYVLAVPSQPDDKSDAAWMATDFANAVRSAFSSAGWMRVKEGAEEGGFFLAGYRGKLYLVEDDFVALELRRGYEAIGTGGPYALGALHAMRGLPGAMCVDVQIARALDAAESLNAGVRGPFTILRGGDSA
jgi:ATP-dependent protease HslVU (ClpYQ) peptidase subunit